LLSIHPAFFQQAEYTLPGRTGQKRFSGMKWNIARNRLSRAEIYCGFDSPISLYSVLFFAPIQGLKILPI
jgi:hypothetical protein